MHHAVLIGVWAQPHPEYPENADFISHIPLYERPPDEAIPKTIQITEIDEDGLEVVKNIRFHDPISGASTRCDGCGEPFGQQIKIRPNMWVSPTGVSYRTDKGLLKYCQDVFACSKRAAERAGTREADNQMADKVVAEAAEKLGSPVPLEGARLCKNPKCRQPFVQNPTTPGQVYHSIDCQQRAAYDRAQARKGPPKKPGRKPKAKEKVIA